MQTHRQTDSYHIIRNTRHECNDEKLFLVNRRENWSVWWSVHRAHSSLNALKNAKRVRVERTNELLSTVNKLPLSPALLCGWFFNDKQHLWAIWMQYAISFIKQRRKKKQQIREWQLTKTNNKMNNCNAKICAEMRDSETCQRKMRTRWREVISTFEKNYFYRI